VLFRSLGRGEGSGLGQQSGKGHKGQRAISGYNHKIGFEGGQMPLQRRIPKYGFKNPFRVEYKGINLDTIQSYVDEGRLTNTITVADLAKAGLVNAKDKVKLLGRGEISKAVNVHVHGFSKTAETKVTKAGGSVTKVEGSNS
jgi:large subunit ribosomal protein L15